MIGWSTGWQFLFLSREAIPMLVINLGVRMVAYCRGWQMATYGSMAMARSTDDSVKEKV